MILGNEYREQIRKRIQDYMNSDANESDKDKYTKTKKQIDYSILAMGFDALKYNVEENDLFNRSDHIAFISLHNNATYNKTLEDNINNAYERITLSLGVEYIDSLTKALITSILNVKYNKTHKTLATIPIVENIYKMYKKLILDMLLAQMDGVKKLSAMNYVIDDDLDMPIHDWFDVLDDYDDLMSMFVSYIHDLINYNREYIKKTFNDEEIYEIKKGV